MTKREDMVHLAEKLMNQQDGIRNIGIVAHIDHGKCIAPWVRVQLADGSFKKAEELFQEAALSGRKAKENESEIVYELDGKMRVFSVDKITGRVEIKPVSHAWKLKGGKTLSVRLRNGFEISTTPEHRFLYFDGKEFSYTEAKNLKLGDRVVVARHTPVDSFENVETMALDALAAHPFYVWLETEKALLLKQKAKSYGLRKLAQKTAPALHAKTVQDCFNKGRFPISFLLSAAEEFGFSKETITGWIREIGLKDSYRMKWPRNWENVFYAAGLMVGDGTGEKFVVGKPALAKKFRAICNELGFDVKPHDYAGKTPELVANKTFSRFLHALFDYPLKQKSHHVKISAVLQRAPSTLSARFLRGYFDCDGSVERARNAVTINSASPEMIRELPLLLARFHCVPIIEKDQTLTISGESLQSFVRHVGFGLPEKMEKARAIAEKCTGSTVCDLVPFKGFRQARENANASKDSIGHHYYKYENQQYTPTRQTYAGLLTKLQERGISSSVNVEDLAFVEIASIQEGFEENVYDFSVPETHNFVAEGIVVHNTTMTDSLIAAAGLISQEMAGKQQFMDYYKLEQERGITINAANISLVYKPGNDEYLINLIDTPGHVDFGGEVIRAMRAVDGVVLVVDAVEGVMPQTETVIRQALRERVQPTLFINKVDRLVNELQVTEEQMQERFLKTITQVNNLIQKNVPEEFKEKWLVKVQEGSVSFGSAYNKWALNFDSMKESGVSFKDVYKHCKEGTQKELAQKSPLHVAILGMVVKHLPNPKKAQYYRIPKIWGGELESEEGKDMLACNPSGIVAMMVNDVSVDPHAGDVATGRLYSGTVKKGVQVHLIGSQKTLIIQQVAIMMGPERVVVDAVPAGNIVALIGLKEVYSGETISSKKIKEFESFMSSTEPVMTVSVEAKSTKDLPKLIEVIRQITKEDPNVRASLNQETGEHLLSGMGELHLDVTRYRIETDHNVPIIVSTPIVVYRETITKESPVIEGKSPNKHNKFKMRCEPIPTELLEKLVESKINGKIRDKDKVIVENMINMGFDREETKKTWCVHNGNMLVDATRGIQSLFEVKELVIQGFQDAMNEGPLAKERCFGVKIVLEDATLHEDSIHRGPAQVLPAITRAVYAAMLSAEAVLLEPKQILTINIPQDFMGAASRELGGRRTQISEMRTEGDTTIIIAKAPVKELIGFSASIRGATEGRAIWTAEYYGYEKLPRELQKPTITEIRKRKGMDPEVKPASFFMD